ncbi:hypothetical protein POSPLADRAFT_1125619, partial [Postia placenta MAD-698-R-SB12]
KLLRKSDQPVASGSFADVWRGQWNAHHVALKSIRISNTIDLQRIMEHFCKEAVLWRHLSHPNITPFLGIDKALFRLCMVSEWMPNGTIMTYVRTNPTVNRRQLVMDVAMGLEYLHSVDMVHGDLKGANIMINEAGNACLSDFGLTGVVYGLDTVNPVTPGSVVPGSIRWMAPESLDPEGAGVETMSALRESDVHSFSMVAWEVFSGKHPYNEYRLDAAVMYQILSGVRPSYPLSAEPLGLCEQVWDLMEQCWHPEWRLRPTMSSAVTRL